MPTVCQVPCYTPFSASFHRSLTAFQEVGCLTQDTIHPPISAAQNNKGLFLAHAAHVNMGCALCSPPSGTHADGVANISIVTWHQGRWQRSVLKVVPQQFSVTTQEATQVILHSQLTGQNASHDPSQPQEGQEMPSSCVPGRWELESAGICTTNGYHIGVFIIPIFIDDNVVALRGEATCPTSHS